MAPSIALVLATLFGPGCATQEPAAASGQEELGGAQPSAAPYAGSSFEGLWREIGSDPYVEMPHYEVTLKSFYGFLENHILAAARRTLSDRNDLLPRFRKLIHPNGLCLAGTWNITEETPYTGYFRKGSRALIILRASTGMSATRRGELRTFGIAGKIFPTTDPSAVVETVNFTTTEDLGGTQRDHFLDALNTNDILKISWPGLFINSGIITALGNAFTTAEKTLDVSQALFRQLYNIAEAGEPDPSSARSPVWVQLTGAPDVPRVDAEDFRDELRVARYPGGLRFEISAADEGTRLGAKNWKKIGYVEVTADALTDTCDNRLHFPHLPFRK
jgi:hypothetical protein